MVHTIIGTLCLEGYRKKAILKRHIDWNLRLYIKKEGMESGPRFDGLVSKCFYGHFLKMYVI